MIEPTSGTLTVNGDDVAKVDPVKLRLGIGYVIQSAGLMPHQRVVDNVATLAPNFAKSPAFVANVGRDRLEVGENQLAAGIRKYEER